MVLYFFSRFKNNNSQNVVSGVPYEGSSSSSNVSCDIHWKDPRSCSKIACHLAIPFYKLRIKLTSIYAALKQMTYVEGDHAFEALGRRECPGSKYYDLGLLND